MQWTLEELADRAARALADADVRVANGRVSGVPDGRLIRWYATIGLVDRPSAGPGRTARYGPRHLWQLVAVKRLQAQGLPLVEIQHRLAGATDETLRRLADIRPDGEMPRAAGLAPAPRFWASRPSAPATPTQPARTALDAGAVHTHDTVEIVHGVRLAGVILLLAAQPDPDDLDAIAAAARPLLDLLAERGLLDPDPTEGSPS